MDADRDQALALVVGRNDQRIVKKRFIQIGKVQAVLVKVGRALRFCSYRLPIDQAFCTYDIKTGRTNGGSKARLPSGLSLGGVPPPFIKRSVGGLEPKVNPLSSLKHHGLAEDFGCRVASDVTEALDFLHELER